MPQISLNNYLDSLVSYSPNPINFGTHTDTGQIESACSCGITFNSWVNGHGYVSRPNITSRINHRIDINGSWFTLTNQFMDNNPVRIPFGNNDFLENTKIEVINTEADTLSPLGSRRVTYPLTTNLVKLCDFVKITQHGANALDMLINIDNLNILSSLSFFHNVYEKKTIYFLLHYFDYVLDKFIDCNFIEQETTIHFDSSELDYLLKVIICLIRQLIRGVTHINYITSTYDFLSRLCKKIRNVANILNDISILDDASLNENDIIERIFLIEGLSEAIQNTHINTTVSNNNLIRMCDSFFNNVIAPDAYAPSFSKICKKRLRLIELFDCEICFGCNKSDGESIQKCRKNNIIRPRKYKMELSKWAELYKLSELNQNMEEELIIEKFLIKNKLIKKTQKKSKQKTDSLSVEERRMEREEDAPRAPIEDDGYVIPDMPIDLPRTYEELINRARTRANEGNLNGDE